MTREKDGFPITHYRYDGDGYEQTLRHKSWCQAMVLITVTHRNLRGSNPHKAFFVSLEHIRNLIGWSCHRLPQFPRF
jgi:hypothetical protein